VNPGNTFEALALGKFPLNLVVYITKFSSTTALILFIEFWIH